MKPIRLSAHALGYTSRRGLTLEEVEDAIRHTDWEAAELRRWECRKNFPFGQEWNGKVYATKSLSLNLVAPQT